MINYLDQFKLIAMATAKTRIILLYGFLTLLFAPNPAHSITFREAIDRIETHDKTSALSSKSEALTQEAKRQGSWGDPSVKVSAKNLPRNSLRDDQTPMSGLEVALSGTIPLSPKRSYYEKSYKKMAESVFWNSTQAKRELQQNLWKHVIEVKKLNRQKQILEENLEWIRQMIDVSKNLYANGRVSQQAILDLQIRKSELHSHLVDLTFEITAQNEILNYLVNNDSSPIELTSVPWHILDLSKHNEPLNSSFELSLAAENKAKEALAQAKANAFIPDLTISLSYTKRANIDDLGDFVSLSAQLPLPISSKPRADYQKAIYEKTASAKRLEDYKKEKNSILKSKKIQNLKLKNQINIIENESIKFARNARDITAKAYELGSETYVALLQSEIKLQDLLLKLSDLSAKKEMTMLEYKFIRGELLHD